jgi:flagellar assembly factor FliW
MTMIKIKEKEYVYNEDEILSFAEGLVGLPEMRRAVLVPMDEFAPFCWLASVEDEKVRFVVVNPNDVFANYKPAISDDPAAQGLKTLTIVKVSSDWTKTTINLRAPIFIDPASRRAAQLVLTESAYSLAEPISQD